MMKGWDSRQFSIKAGQVKPYKPRSNAVNALLFINNNGSALAASSGSDPQTRPEWTIQPNGQTPVPLPMNGATMNIYSAADAIITVVEIITDNPQVVFTFGVTNVTAGSFTLTSDANREVGKTGLKVKGADVADVNPVPMKRTEAASVANTFGASAAFTVKAAAGMVHALAAIGTALTLRDNGVDKFQIPANTAISFPTPLKITTSIVIFAAAAGSGYCQYE